MFFDDIAGFLECHPGFYECNGFGQTLSCTFDDSDRGGVGEGFGANVVSFVEVAVKTAVVERYV